MENRSAENSDGLEISSIGSLYVGPWDKKYWSCSRGKERYPYPVGYHAIRNQGGNICQLEVCEGLKGPLFVIKAVDGSSFSGQTPDIAWEKFQKKCPKAKKWNGKRFSIKIDGAEFFGFKNPSIQRLLRELVNMTHRRSLFSPFFYRGSKNKDQTPTQVTDQYHNLVPALEDEHSSPKKFRKKRNARKNIIREARPKKIRLQGCQSNSKTCILHQTDDLCSISPDRKAMQLKRKHIVSHTEDSPNEGTASHHSTSTNGIFSSIMHLKASDFQHQMETKIILSANGNSNEETSLIMQGEPEVNCQSVLSSNKISMGLDCSNFVDDKHIVSQQNNNVDTQQNNCVDTETLRFTTSLDDISNAIKIMLHRCPDVVNERSNPASSALTGEIAISALDHLNETSICMKNELVAVKPWSITSKSHSIEVASKSELKGLTSRSIPCGSEPRYLKPHDAGCMLEDGIYQIVAKDSLPEVGSCGLSDRSFEDVDLDLAGQELAKSMLSFLLPQAVPLLKKTYVRRRSRARPLEANGSCFTLTDRNSADSNTVNDHLNYIVHQGKLVAGVDPFQEKATKEAIDASKTSSRVCSSYDFNSFNPHLANGQVSVVPDSLENDINSWSASLKEYQCMGLNESDIAPQNDVKGNIDTSSLLITDVDEVKHITKNTNHVAEDLSSSFVACAMRSSSLHFNHESKRNAEEVSLQLALGKNLTITENFEQITPALCHVRDILVDNEVSTEVIESRNSFGSIKGKQESYSPIEVVNFAMHEINKGRPMSENKNHSSSSFPKGVLVDGGVLVDASEAQHLNGVIPSSGQCNASMSETILCQNSNNSDVPELNTTRKSLLSVKNYQSSHIDYKADSRMLAVYEVETAEPKISLRNIPNASKREANWLITDAKPFQSQDVDKNITEIIEVPQTKHSPLNVNADPMDKVSRVSMPGMCSLLGVEEEIKEIPERSETFTHSQLQLSNKNSLMETSFCSDKNSVLQPITNNRHNNPSHAGIYKKIFLDGLLAKRLNWNEGDKYMELVGCYLHPEPVLSILLTANKNQLQLGVLCGFPDGQNRHIFMYDVSIQKQRRGCPSFLGHTPLLLPLVRNRWNQNIPFERSALQFTPDGQSLIFVNSIKVPRCREQNINCLCSNCISESSKETTLEIVHVNFGYVSRTKKLTTGKEISCISVCEPNYLVAVEENGGLHVWEMNLMWSHDLEEFMLPTFDHMSPRILELTRIPNYNSLIIGHNGLGDFGIWDISKRVLLAKFSSPGSTVFQIIPISVFNWQLNETSLTTQSFEHIMENMQKTNCEISLGSSFGDISIWILISTAPVLETEPGEMGLGTSPTGLWRLALMTRNVIIMGNILDPRATAVDASVDSGIIGTSDGFLYKWELSSGRKLGNLSFILGGISCVALDSKSGALAATGRDGKLLVFIES